jgi:V8-like Glu-specific endopeptidase
MRKQIKNILFFSLTAFIFSSAMLYPVAHSETFAGETESIDLKTAQPYLSEKPGEVVEYFEISKPGATFILVHFNNFSLNDGDYVEIRDRDNILRQTIDNDTHGRTDFWSLAVDGDTVSISLVSGPAEGRSYGFEIDQYGYGIVPFSIENTCGTEDKVDIECVSGTTQYQRARSVGRMLYQKGSSFFLCTGSLISAENHFLTNEHCVDSQIVTDTLQVRFNFQYTTCDGFNLASYDTYYGDAFLVADFDYDLSLLTLFGNPQAKYGYLELEPRAMVLNELVYIPQHPGGGEKKYDEGPVVDPVAFGRTFNSDFGYQVDTLGGSSGSPVLSLNSHKVVGLHHFGGCFTTPPFGQNQGVLMSNIYPIIEPFLPSAESDELAYTPVTPCRIVDTRNTSAGMIGASTQRNFRVFGSGSAISSQGGAAAGCPSPLGEPLAAHINVIAVDPTGKGNLQAFPVGAGSGAGLTVNYNTIDTNLANAGTVKTVTGGGADFTVASNFASAHTVIDVMGYYYPDGDLLYASVTPCRIVDTRNTTAGIIAASTQRNFRVFGSGGAISAQGGTAAGCPSPLGEALAAHINMVAVDPIGKGNLQAFPVGAGTGTGLSVNYNTIDTNLANAGTVKTVTGGGADITVASNFSSAHAAIDVLGYYYPAGELLYTPVTPCRIIDTRNTSAGIIAASTQRNFRVFGSGGVISAQGGTAAGCPSPMGEPLAAHINVIAVDPTGKGNLQAFPVGSSAGAGLSVNYNTIDTNLANAGTVKTVTGGGADITVASNFSSAHTVVDVLGYYYAAP